MLSSRPADPLTLKQFPMTTTQQRHSMKRSEVGTSSNESSPNERASPSSANASPPSKPETNKRPNLNGGRGTGSSPRGKAKSEGDANNNKGGCPSPSSPASKRRWSKQEDEKLCAAVKGVGLNDWKTIAKVYMAGHELSDAQCMHRWQKVLRPGLVKGAFCEKEDRVIVDCLREGGLKRRWTKQEDEKLCAAVKAVGTNNWKQIAEVNLAGHGRSDVQCLHRWQKVLRAGLVKGAFTEEEDKIIIECMREGNLTWMQIAERIPGRIGKQCRERWTNHLDPNLKKGGWTHEEDTILAEAQQRWGNAWTKIAKLLPGRAENAVKNRWNSAFRRKKSAQFGKAGGPAEEENTAAIAKARAAMELLDKDEKDVSCTGSDSGLNTANPHHHHHAGPSKPRGTKRSSSSGSSSNASRLGGANNKNNNNNNNTGAASNQFMDAGESQIPALRIPGSAFAQTFNDLSPHYVADYQQSGPLSSSGSTSLTSGSSAHPHSLSGLPHSAPPSAVGLHGDVTEDSSPSEVLDLFGDFDKATRDMDDHELLSLDGVDDDDDDEGGHCDLDVSLDNLDVVEARFEPSDERLRLSGPIGALGTSSENPVGHHHHHMSEGSGDHNHLSNGHHHLAESIDYDDDHHASHHHHQRGQHGPPPALQLSRSPLPNCPEDDLFLVTERTGLTPNGPMQKTPSGMMSGLSPHDMSCSTNGFSPFADNGDDDDHPGVLDPDLTLGIDIPRAIHDHDFMSPNDSEYHASWGLPAPEVRLPPKVSELLSHANLMSRNKPLPLLRNWSTATDVTITSHRSPTNIMDGPPPAGTVV